MKNKEDYFKILRKIHKSPSRSQRGLASGSWYQSRKLNYCMKALQEKGLIKKKILKKIKKKINYIYVLTPQGIATKTRLTINFMKRKLKEYDELKKEIERDKNKS